MELVTVKIKTTVITARYGTLVSGDLLRTDADFAEHLVKECGAASYVAPVVADPVAEEAASAEKPARKKKAKE